MDELGLFFKALSEKGLVQKSKKNVKEVKSPNNALQQHFLWQPMVQKYLKQL